MQKVFNTANASLHERVADSGLQLLILYEQAHLYTSHNCSYKNGILICVYQLNELSQCCILGKRYYWNQLTESNEKLHWLRFNAEMGFEDVDDSEDEGKVKNM